jgi:hypothetical protein
MTESSMTTGFRSVYSVARYLLNSISFWIVDTIFLIFSLLAIFQNTVWHPTAMMWNNFIGVYFLFTIVDVIMHAIKSCIDRRRVTEYETADRDKAKKDSRGPFYRSQWCLLMGVLRCVFSLLLFIEVMIIYNAARDVDGVGGEDTLDSGFRSGSQLITNQMLQYHAFLNHVWFLWILGTVAVVGEVVMANKAIPEK